MIHSTLRIVTDPAKLAEAFAILLSMAERIRVMSGCIACRVYRDAQEQSSLMFEEIWKNEEDLNRHIRSEEYRNVLLVAEMAVEKPEIRFETVSLVTGMETIEKVRSSA
jgi:quinol monooxygenase YgiN